MIDAQTDAQTQKDALTRAEESVELGRGGPLKVRHDVTVDVHRRGDRRVAESLLNDLRVLAESQKQRRGRMPQIVEANIGKLSLREQQLERTTNEVLPLDRLADFVREDQIEAVVPDVAVAHLVFDLFGLVALQCVNRHGGHRDRTATFRRLGLSKRQSVFLGPSQRPSYLKRAGLPVQIIPPERENLVEAQAAGHRDAHCIEYTGRSDRYGDGDGNASLPVWIRFRQFQ